MSRILRSFLATLLLGAAVESIHAQEPIRFARTPDISPDGKLVAFSYQGDIWTVETIGGTARAVTSHPAHDIGPVFSPDGRNIAFSSNRHGSYNIYVVPVQGGKPRRLTFDSSNDSVNCWSRDGKHILFTSTRSTAFPRNLELYTVPVEGGMVRKASAAEGKDGSYSPDGTKIAYVRGPGDWYRKGYRGSSNDDIWICNVDGTGNKKVTTFNGQDSSPMWSGDGRTLYYVSEFHGTPANIVRQPAQAIAASAPGAKTGETPKLVTTHKDDSVRRARISAGGEWIVYECGADLWVVGTKEGSTPRKLAIEVNADDKSNPERVLTYTNGITEFAMSSDEKHIAFALHGKLFMMAVSATPKPLQLTTGASNDHSPAWAPDGSKLIFISDRGGYEDIYVVESNDPEHPKLIDAKAFKEPKQLTNTRESESGVSFSPDGKRVAFLRAGKLWTMNPDGTDQKAVVNDVTVIDYEWAPDSKWLCYSRRDGSDASELYIIPSTGATDKEPARNVTRYATYNAGVTWSADGKRLCFLSDRSGDGTLFVLPLQKPAGPDFVEKPGFSLSTPPVNFDWEDIHLRAKNVLPLPVREATISKTGDRIAFRMFDDLYVCKLGTDLKGEQVQRITTGNLQPRQIQFSKLRSAIYFLDGHGNIRLAPTMTLALPGEKKSDTPDSIPLPFKVRMTVRTAEEYQEMFDQSWRFLAEHFYDTKFHGLNWDEVKAKYRPLVKHVSMKEDLYALMYLMMGELNASHLGVFGTPRAPEEQTADLGLLFDESYRGKGLKISEILKRGPADRRGITLKPGEFIVGIDGVELTDSTDISKLLNGKVGETVVLSVTSNPAADPRDPKARRKVLLQATGRSEAVDLMYERWVENNAKRVSELSKGRLGYIHIPDMTQPGLDRFVRSLYSENFDKEAIVLDVRFNGGGFTHDQVLNYLTGREHTYFRERNGGEGLVTRPGDRKWTKPLIMLINNRSYSDAEILPNAFRTLGLGKLVGQPTSGAVIGTGQLRLIDGSIFLVPRIGVYTTKGINMEKEGVKPDFPVENHPDELAKGLDPQLDKAVEVLQIELAQKKKTGPSVATKPDGKMTEAPPMIEPMPMAK
jgi:tricorn protease